MSLLKWSSWWSFRPIEMFDGFIDAPETTAVQCLELEVGLKDNDDQCDQIGRFFKDLGNKFSFKSSQNIWCLCWPILKMSLLSMMWLRFWQLLGQLGFS